jgi:hypothetical protein
MQNDRLDLRKILKASLMAHYMNASRLRKFRVHDYHRISCRFDLVMA